MAPVPVRDFFGNEYNIFNTPGAIYSRGNLLNMAHLIVLIVIIAKGIEYICMYIALYATCGTRKDVQYFSSFINWQMTF